jgi:prepilin-type processing-associated H-X9-DG protein
VLVLSALICAVRFQAVTAMMLLKLRDWMALFAIVLVALAVVLTIVRARATTAAERIKCAKQLRSLGQAIFLYSNENRGRFPCTTYRPGAVVTPTWGTGATAQDPFGLGGPEPNDVSAAIFLLLRTQEATSDVFVCPASDAEKWDYGGSSSHALNWSNWPGREGIRRHLSYSYQNPYPDEGYKERAIPTRYLGTLAGTAIMADVNPGTIDADVLIVTPNSSTEQLRRANSRNHARRGQNVLYHDGHVEFRTTPFCGWQGDNIYARRAAASGSASSEVANSPYDLNDSVLLPTDD